MKKLIISLCVLAAVSFTACGGSAKTETPVTDAPVVENPAPEVEAPVEKTVAQLYAELLTKSAELTEKVKAGDVTVAAEAAKLQEEMTKFLEDNKEAIANFTEEEKAEIAKVQEAVVAKVAPEAAKK